MAGGYHGAVTFDNLLDMPWSDEPGGILWLYQRLKKHRDAEAAAWRRH